MSDYQHLKTRQRAERANYPEHLSLRVHRALSWLDRADQCEDSDGRFIFLWIAFNAAYAKETGQERTPDARLLHEFINRLVASDRNKELSTIIWDKYAGPIRLLLTNQFVFQPYWDFQNGYPGSGNWEAKFTYAKKAANKAIGHQDTVKVLSIIFSRLYTLRNQLIHGGATFAGKVNRQQVGDGANLLGRLVPCVISLMMDNPHEEWGQACYPVQVDYLAVRYR
jgi:hypothetical protein